MKSEERSIKKIIKRRIEFPKQKTKMNERQKLRTTGKPKLINVSLMTRNEIRRGKPNVNNNKINVSLDTHSLKTYIFNQYGGIGDILFIEPIIRKYFQNGHPVILPVLKQFLSLQQYFPYIKFINMDLMDIDYNEKKIIENENSVIIPLRHSSAVMSNKYKMVNMDFNMWRTLTWLRHRYKEENLKKILEIETGDKYNLINENFNSHYPFLKRNISVKNKYKNIKMSTIDGYNLLDWSGVIETATTIHSVNTSIMYLLEMLELSTTDIHIYSRTGENNHDFRKIKNLFNLKYNKHN